MKKTTKKTRTAADAHHEHAAAIVKMAQELLHHYQVLDEQARDDSHEFTPNWGDVGSVASTASDLREIYESTFLLGEYHPDNRA